MSTHGVVQARLILNGQDKGPHLFIVQRAFVFLGFLATFAVRFHEN